MSFVLSCESTVDLKREYVEGRGISVLCYQYCVDGEFFDDPMGEKTGIDQFYEKLLSGAKITTSQMNGETYRAYFEKLLKGSDVLHICFGSGMSGSVYNAMRAAEEINAESEHKVYVVDSLCSSTGYGMLVDTAADLRDAGAEITEVYEKACRLGKRIEHRFFSTDLTFFKKSGRVSGPAAAVAAILNICPLMKLDGEGKIVAYDKIRGKKNAIKQIVKDMAVLAEGGADYSGKCYICHSNCEEQAQALKEAVLDGFKNIKDIEICDVGPVIACHSGPGTAAVFYVGKEDRA